MYGRVLSVMRSWLGASGPEPRLRMIREKGGPKLFGEDGYVSVELPFGWLVDVWAQGLAIVWGRLCLAARSADDERTWRPRRSVGTWLGRRGHCSSARDGQGIRSDPPGRGRRVERVFQLSAIAESELLHRAVQVGLDRTN